MFSSRHKACDNRKVIHGTDPRDFCSTRGNGSRDGLESLKTQALPNSAHGPGAIEGIKVQAGCAGLEQAIAEFGGYVETESANGVQILAESLESSANPTGNFGAAGIRKPGELFVVPPSGGLSHAASWKRSLGAPSPSSARDNAPSRRSASAKSSHAA